MRIDLFKNQEVQRHYTRIGNQIITRSYKLLDDCYKRKIERMEYNSPKFNEYKKHILELINNPVRKRVDLVGGFTDPLADLEYLGIGEYCMKYTIIVEFENILDLVLAIMTGCNMSNITKLENYNKISKAVLFDTEIMKDFNIMDLVKVDPNIENYFVNIAFECNKMYYQKNLSADKLAKEVAYKFYENIMLTLSDIENYTGTAIKYIKKESEAVYRSKTATRIILTSDIKLPNEIELVYGDYVKKVPVLSLERLEYLERIGAYFEKDWLLQNR